MEPIVKVTLRQGIKQNDLTEAGSEVGSGISLQSVLFIKMLSGNTPVRRETGQRLLQQG
jgi:hypothetical protein